MKKDSYYIELEKEGYYDTVDKRSKDYRDYKKWLKKSNNYKSLKENVGNQPKGLGDTVAKITEATGIKKLVKFIAGEDCGCDERQDLLNKKFKYGKVNCISENDYNYATKFFEGNTNKVTNNQQIRMNKIHNNVFGTNKSTTSCVSCVVKTIENIKKYLQVYK
tara:strand:- start:4125 stop:4613 length:489 start_codon:yes stop_codon:yes gene_type:complete